MAGAETSVYVVANTAQAEKALKAFGKSASDSLGAIKFNTAFSAFKDLGETVLGVFERVKGTLEGFIHAASESDQATTNLGVALKLAGNFTGDARNEFQGFASALERVTVFSDEAILNASALAQNFRVTKEQTKQLVTAATDLAAATGTDLNSAVNELGRSLEGTLGRGIKHIVPDLQNLSEAQLRSGFAIDFVQKRLAGFATALGGTFQGTLKRAENSFDNFKEALGGLVVNSPVVVGFIDLLNKGFEKFTEQLAKNAGALQKQVNRALLDLIKLTPLVIDAVNLVSTTFLGLEYVFKTLSAAAILLTAFLAASAEQKRLGGTDNREYLESSAAIFKAAIDEIKALKDAAAESTRSLQSRKDAVEDLKKAIVSFTNAQEKEANSSVSNNKRAEDAIKNRSKAVRIDFQITRDILEKIDAAAKKYDSEGGFFAKIFGSFELPKDVKDLVAKAGGKGFEIKARFDASLLGEELKGAISDAFRGAQGSKDFVVNTADKVFKASEKALTQAFGEIVPVIGPLLGPLLEGLAAGPDAAKSFVTEFIKGVPQIIQNIADSIPVVIDAIVEQLPYIATKLSNQFLTLPTVLVFHLIRNIPKMVEGFSREFLKIPGQFVDALLKALNDGLDSITGFLSGGGGGTGGAIRGSGFRRLGTAAVTGGFSEVAGGGCRFLRTKTKIHA